jgi:hypothetical protein
MSELPILSSLPDQLALRPLVALSAEQYIGYLLDKKGAPRIAEIVRSKVCACAAHPPFSATRSKTKSRHLLFVGWTILLRVTRALCRPSCSLAKYCRRPPVDHERDRTELEKRITIIFWNLSKPSKIPFSVTNHNPIHSSARYRSGSKARQRLSPCSSFTHK